MLFMNFNNALSFSLNSDVLDVFMPIITFYVIFRNGNFNGIPVLFIPGNSGSFKQGL